MSKNNWVLLLLMLSGVVLGGFLGYLTKDISWLSWLNYGQTFGIGGADGSALVLNLGVMILQLGLQIKITIGSMIGIVLAILLYRKL